MANPVIHIEHIFSSVEPGINFYTQLFDWEVEDMPVPNDAPYKVVKSKEGPNIGFLAVPDISKPSWLTYIRVDDIQASVVKAKELGATIIEDIAEFGEYGWSSVISDPTGAIFAIWQYKGEH